jgi:hypothetical protein
MAAAAEHRGGRRRADLGREAVRFPWYEPEARPAAATAPQGTLFGGDLLPVEKFHSGGSAYWDFRGFMLAGAPVGITATEVPKGGAERLLELVATYTAKGGLVFVDSGAFGAFVAGQRLDFEAQVFPVYDQILARCVAPQNLRLVMPDVVGNPEASMALQEAHAGRLAGWCRSGARCIFPLHSPSDERFLSAVDRVTEGQAYTVGVPFNLEAWTVAELLRFCDRHKPHGIHLLGLGRIERVRAIAEGVAQASPHTAVSCDSCTLLAHVGEGRRLTDRCRTRLRDATRWVMTDTAADVPFPVLSTFVTHALWTPRFLLDHEVAMIARRFNLPEGDLIAVGRTEGLLAMLGPLDPDEEWLEPQLFDFLEREIYGPALAGVLRGPIRAWEVARLAGMPDHELGEGV